MSFDEIILTKDELAALKYLNKSGAILVEGSNRAILERLIFFEFVQFFTITEPESRKIAVKKTGQFAPQGARITDLGKSYLAYTAAKEKDEKRSAWRDLLFILIGSAITFLFDHHSLLVECFKRLVQIWAK